MSGIIDNLKKIYQGLIARFYRNKTVYPYFESFFEGKSIAIIGGADTALIEKNGNYIDSFDIVIRVNRGIDNYEDKSDYLGKKTDVIFHGLNEDPINGCGPVRPMEWKKKNVKYVIFPLFGSEHNALIHHYIIKSRGALPLLQISNYLHKEITHDLDGFRTTTGFAAINLMSKVKYKKLYITGFSFFRTAHQRGYNDLIKIEEIRENIKTLNNHNPDKEFEYFKNFYLKSTNVEIDSGMKLIFK